MSSEKLGEAVVQDVDGNEVRLFRFWSEKPAVVVFVRHFG